MPLSIPDVLKFGKANGQITALIKEDGFEFFENT
jgi:hypothetical protein